MAEAFVRYVDVPVTTYTSVRDGVTLTLSDREAAALQLVLRRVGGDPEKSARRYVDRIEKALNHTLPKYEYKGWEKEQALVDKENARIYFTPKSLTAIERFEDK